MDFKSKIRRLYKYEKNLLLDPVIMYEVVDEFQNKLLVIIETIDDIEVKLAIANAINQLSYALKERKVRRQLVAFDTAAHLIHPHWDKSPALAKLVAELKERRWDA